MDFFDETTTIKSSNNCQTENLQNPTSISYFNETTNINIGKNPTNLNENVSCYPRKSPSINSPIIHISNVKKENTLNISPHITLKNSSATPMTPINVIKIINKPNSAQKINCYQTPSSNNLRITPVNVKTITGLKRPLEFTNDLPNKVMKTEHNMHSPMINNSQRFNFPVANFQNNLTAKEYKFEESEFGELTYNDAYSNYQPAKIKFGRPHPYLVVESRSLSTEEAPPVKYQLSLPSKVIDKGILSNVQLEAVIYACQRHEDFLTDGRRAGFFIGDGAGVGKGRTVAGIIYENFLNGRNKAIWVSVSADLRVDAKRDLRDIGKVIGVDIKVRSLNEMSYSKIESKDKFNQGVLFVTYSCLISTCNNDKSVFKSRFDQIVKWFGKNYDGVIILDECHKAKNLHQSSKTKTGTIVKKLQDTLKQARIVYASATGASESKHMAYMVRLGLWGPGKAFKKFEEFETTLTKHGVGAMELVAMLMKRKGMYLARQLSFEDVKFEIQEMKIENCTINGHKFKDIYNKCVLLWSDIYQEFKAALKRNRNNFDKEDNSFESQFWSAHQRFFKYLCISAKVQECVTIATDQIKKGKCIVIGLQSTGESSMVSSLEENSDEIQKVSNAKSVLKNLIKNHYPSMKNLKRNQETKELKSNKQSIKKPVEKIKPKEKNKKEIFNDLNSDGEETDSDSNYSDSDLDEKEIMKSYESDDDIEMVDDVDVFSDDWKIQKRLLDDIENMDSMFPINALDQLIQEFGGPNYVAELTGRKGRMVAIDGGYSYQSRKEGDVSLDQINLLEKDRFNNGEKLVAIISDAASTGISLHSDQRFNNQLERFHITLELPWSADKAIQQFGRTHRSNQVNPPHYLFLISDLPGERRFAATVAKRLESLGALTHGDRRCADTRDLSQFNLDNEFGNKAVKILINTILHHISPTVPFPAEHMKKFNNNMLNFKKAAQQTLISVGLDQNKNITVTKFLNRLLGIELDLQNALFQYFMDIIEQESNRAKLCNQFDHGIRDIMNDHDNIFKDDPEVIPLLLNNDRANGSVKWNDDPDEHVVSIHKITNIFMGVTWKRAEEIYLKNRFKNMFCESNNNSVKILALAEHQNGDKFKLITPNFPEKDIDEQTLVKLYNKIDYSNVKGFWEYLYRESENRCLHNICNEKCFGPNFCTFGKRTKVNHIITGDIFLAWKKISASNPNTKMEIVRVQLHDKSKLIGALISPRFYDNFKEILTKK